MSEIRKNKSDFSLATGEITREEKVDAANNSSTTLGTKIDKVNDGITTRAEGTSYVVLTVSGTVGSAGAKTLKGYIIASHTVGATIKFWDNTAGSGTVLMDTTTTTANTKVGEFLSLGDLSAGTGIYCTISGTISLTAVYIDPTIV